MATVSSLTSVHVVQASQKPWMQETRSQKIFRIAWDVIRGLGVFWLLAQVLRPLIRMMVLPASIARFQAFEKCRKIFASRMNEKGFCTEFHSVKTPDGVLLDAAVVSRGNGPSTPILIFNPNGISFSLHANSDMDHSLVKRAFMKHVTSCSFVFFDYRGVGRSTGSVRGDRDLIMDGACMLQFTKKHFGADKIHTWGHSLGGVVSAMAREATDYQDGLHLSDRSPASISLFLQKKCGIVFGSFLAYLASLAGFELKGAKAFERLTGEKWATYHSQDRMILPGASIAEANPNPQSGRKVKLEKNLPMFLYIDPHRSPACQFSESEQILSRFIT